MVDEEQTQKQTQTLVQRQKRIKGVDNKMLASLQGRVLYIQSIDNPSNPFSGKLESFGETFLKLVEVTLYFDQYDIGALWSMKNALEEERRVTKISTPVYKNRTDIGTLVDLYAGAL